MNGTWIAALALALAQGQGQPQPPAASQNEAPPGARVPAGPVITIEEALERAAAENLDLKAAKARLSQAYQLSWKAWSSYLPQVAAGGTYTRNNIAIDIELPVGYAVRERTGAPGTAGNPNDPGGLPGNPSPYFAVPSVVYDIPFQKLDQLNAQITANQALIAPAAWFAIRNAYRVERVSELTYDATRREILFAVAQAYYGTASLKKLMEVSARLLEIAQRQEKDATVRFKAGTIARVGLLRAEIDRARAEQDLVRARNSYQSALVGLATLLDRAPDFDVGEPPEPPLPGDLASLEETALRARPDVRAVREGVDVARTSRNAIGAQYLPMLGAFGRYTWANVSGFSGKDTAWAVGVALQWNLLDGGLREANLREANARIVEAEANRASAELKARADVRQALLDLESARANANKSKEQRDLATENQRLIDVSYRAGAATALEQADATAALRNAEIAFSTDTLQAQLAAVRLLKVAGEYDPVPRR